MSSKTATLKRSKRDWFPSPELDLGNIVRLKKPYRGYRNGIIVQHVGVNVMCVPKVCLYLFDDKGRLYMEDDGQDIARVDTPASSFAIVRIAARVGKLMDDCKRVDNGLINGGDGFFMFPTCPACNDEVGLGECDRCGGNGFLRNRRKGPFRLRRSLTYCHSALAR